MDEFVLSFINEAKELLSNLEKDLLKLEKDFQNQELIDNIFRIMHTLKGAAGMYGFENIEKFTHEFENTYDLIRDNKLKVTPNLIDTTLKATDIIHKMLDRKDDSENTSQLLNYLANYCNESSLISSSETIPEKAHPAEAQYYGILFQPSKDVFERGINPEATIAEVQEFGPNSILIHEKGLSWEKQKKKKICTTTWELYLKTKSSLIDIENIFMFFGEHEFSVLPIDPSAIAKDSVFVVQLSNFYPEFNAIKEQIVGSIKHLDSQKQFIQTESSESETVQDDSSQNTNGAVLKRNSISDNDFSINVSSSKLDELLNLVSELVTSTASIQIQAERLKDNTLLEAVENIEKLTKQFRNNALDLRLIPINTLLGKFNRQVRDLSKELGKEIELIVEDHDTEIDKSILKAIENPLLHIIRNSIDHGIEDTNERKKAGKSPKGLLKIISFYSGANVIIQVQDDGRGINLDRVKECAIQKGYIEQDQDVSEKELLTLILEPGFTTNKNVSMVSGRGVGMDVVRKELSEVKGSLEIDTEKGLGTFITLKLPTTLSIIDTLMVDVQGLNYLLPLLEIEYCFNEKSETLINAENKCIRYKEDLIPYISLREKFSFPKSENDEIMVIVINKYDKKYALIVDHIVDEQQTVIKNMGLLFNNQPYFSGGNIMSNGKIALILDTNYLFNQVISN